MELSIVILAAGLGKRMHSTLPKVLHHLAGKPLLEHVVGLAEQLAIGTPPIVVCGHQSEKVRQALAHLSIEWVEQREQKGTGHAVQQALPVIPTENNVLILYGDVPLISPETLKELIVHTPTDGIGMITAQFPDPSGLGRIVRDAYNKILRIVEEKDADKAQRAIQEINSGIYLVPARYLQRWLPTLTPHNAQQEFYFTDIIPIAVKENIAIQSIQPRHYEEVLGVNDCAQLARLERFYQYQLATQFMQRGVTLLDPHRFDVRGQLTVGQDTIIDVNVVIEGNVTLGSHCVIGPNTVLKNVVVGDRVMIKANSVIEGAEIANDCVIGPFARLRPGAKLAPNIHVGNFVEIKNSIIGIATKINHLSYIGDSDIGNHVNIGAGTITCNYDGVNKHKTVIGDHAFIGSNTALIAPVTIGEEATIGAGSIITNSAPAQQLTLNRAPQRSFPNWQRPKKETLEK